MDDELLYDEVASELQTKAMIPGVWTKAFAEADGDMNRARALYIKYRVGQLAQAKTQRHDEARRSALEVTKQRTLSNIGKFAYSLLSAMFGFITFVLALGILVPLTDSSGAKIGDAVFLALFALLFGFATRLCYTAAQRR